MPCKQFSIKLRPELVECAREMHAVSRIGDERRGGPGQSLESFLSDLVTVAIIERQAPKKPAQSCSNGQNQARQLSS